MSDESGQAFGIVTKREWLAWLAPADEIESAFPINIEGCARILNIPVENYVKGGQHYFQVLAKLRFAWADAMLAETAKEK